MDGSECDMEIWRPEFENVTWGRRFQLEMESPLDLFISLPASTVDRDVKSLHQTLLEYYL